MSAREPSPAEALVRQRDDAAADVRKIDAAMREMRLGRRLAQTRRTGRFLWAAGGFGGGWFGSDKVEPLRLSPDIEREFYTFLGARLTVAGDRVNLLDARLAALTTTTEDQP